MAQAAVRTGFTSKIFTFSDYACSDLQNTHLHKDLIHLLGKMKPTGRLPELPPQRASIGESAINKEKCSGERDILQAEVLTAKHHFFYLP